MDTYTIFDLAQLKIQALNLARDMFSQNMNDYINDANKIYEYLIAATPVSDVTPIIPYPMGDGKENKAFGDIPFEKH